MTDDRSERLRKRRKQSTEDAESRRRDVSEPAGEATPSEAADRADAGQNGADGRDSTDEQRPAESVKEEQVGTYMYLPESQTKELRRLYNVLKADYEFEYDEEFEKNRHFYPLVIEYGLDRLDGLDASEVRTHLEELQ
jgi:hypothetical protein